MNLPKPLRVLWRGWMAIAHAIGRVMSAILLTIFWIVGIGSYAVIAKFIKLWKQDKAQTTYWVSVESSSDLTHPF
jgi:hypothetical protein